MSFFQELSDWVFPYPNKKLSSPTYASIGGGFNLLTLSDFGYSPSSHRLLGASYRHRFRIDQPSSPFYRTFGSPAFFFLEAGGNLKDAITEPVITAGFTGGENRLSTTFMPMTRDFIANFSSSELLEGAVFRASFGDLISRQDYAAVDLKYPSGSSTFRFDSTGTVSAAGVLHRNGVAVGAELVAPTRFALNSVSENKKNPRTRLQLRPRVQTIGELSMEYFFNNQETSVIAFDNLPSRDYP
jgi:hypothetical protein